MSPFFHDCGCMCESSLCDHDSACTRPADKRLIMAYVSNTCTQCASNMVSSGGEAYITLNEEEI